MYQYHIDTNTITLFSLKGTQSMTSLAIAKSLVVLKMTYSRWGVVDMGMSDDKHTSGLGLTLLGGYMLFYNSRHFFFIFFQPSHIIAEVFFFRPPEKIPKTWKSTKLGSDFTPYFYRIIWCILTSWAFSTPLIQCFSFDKPMKTQFYYFNFVSTIFF